MSTTENVEQTSSAAVRSFSTAWQRSHLAARGLDNQCGPLKAYLRPGLEVLDAGCGPGTITADVAAVVSPGTVRGVDLVEQSIEQARELAASMGAANLSFEVGDCNALRFADQSFDLVYSNSMLEYQRDPAVTLAELRRVTRRGGWLVAITTSNVDRLFYPRCPTVEKILAAFMAYGDPSRADFFQDMLCARKTAGAFRAAGLQALQVEAYGAPVDCVYPGSQYFDYRHDALVGFLGDPQRWRRIIAAGLLDEAAVLQARRELDEWHAHPSAFYLQYRLLVAARCG